MSTENKYASAGQPFTVEEKLRFAKLALEKILYGKPLGTPLVNHYLDMQKIAFEALVKIRGW